MATKSAGILFFRVHKKLLEVFLVHPGGPFWAKKDAGAWTIPKGEMEEGEEPLATAIREVKEETGINVSGNLIALTPVKQKAGKLVYAWATEAAIDPSKIKSNLFEMEWPPKSGTKKTFLEIDRASWFTIGAATIKILPAQQPLLRELESILN